MVSDNKVIRKFRTKLVFKLWVDFMTLRSDYMVMILQAQRYNHQALTSKALLSLYTHTIKQRKAKKFRLKAVFRKYFKRTWVPQYIKSAALRKVVQRLHQRTLDWERARY